MKAKSKREGKIVKQKLRTFLLTMAFVLLQTITVMAAGNSTSDAITISTGRDYNGNLRMQHR